MVKELEKQIVVVSANSVINVSEKLFTVSRVIVVEKIETKISKKKTEPRSKHADMFLIVLKIFIFSGISVTNNVNNLVFSPSKTDSSCIFYRSGMENNSDKDT